MPAQTISHQFEERGTRKHIDSQTIAHLARLLKEHPQHNYILGGGAALSLEVSTRKTSDIDILVPAEVADSIVGSASGDCLAVKDGRLISSQTRHIYPSTYLRKLPGK